MEKSQGGGGAHLAGSNGDREKRTGQDRPAGFHLRFRRGSGVWRYWRKSPRAGEQLARPATLLRRHGAREPGACLPRQRGRRRDGHLGSSGGAGPHSRGHCVVRSRMDQQQRRRAEGACGPGANTYARPAARRRAFRCVSLFGEGMFDRLKQIKVELNSEISQNKSCRPRIRLQL
jgi:hypothetical protein